MLRNYYDPSAFPFVSEKNYFSRYFKTENP